ncbi:MAG: DUF6089 family protein [Tannerella sp.]|nr:DUF6089 family protein [Tannerella sp.]
MKSTFFQRTVITLLLGASSFAINAQEYLYETGGMAGGAFYMGDANNNAAFKNMNPAISLLFRYNVNFRTALKANLAFARITGSTENLKNVFPDNRQVTFERSVIDFGVQGEFNFFPYSDKYKYLYTKRISPYIAGGFGVSAAPGSKGGDMFFSPHISAGTGVKYKLMPRINVGAELSIRKLFGDGLDTMGDNKLLDNPYQITSGIFKNKDWYSMLVITVSYDFGLRDCNCNKDNK